MPDTIFALSSGRTPSGIAVVRLSGPDAGVALTRLAGGITSARQAALRTVRGLDGAVLDRALVLYFPGPRSETGEDCVEFHLHGGRAVVARMLEALGGLPGFRLAEAGEFIRRSFLNGKLDLVGVEALGDLINAETEAQRRFALENSGQAQSRLYAAWRARLLHARAMIEAELDFADEGDVPGSVADAVWKDVHSLLDEMRGHIEGYRRSEIIQDGFRVVLAGPPNAGKSSLLNALAQRDVAIVSDEPGTTRDVIEVALDLGGLKVIVADTAGLRADASGVEALGIERSRARIAEAHLILAIEPIGDESGDVVTSGVDIVRIRSKADLAREVETDIMSVSALTGQGLPELLEFLQDKASSAGALVGDVLPSRLRHVSLFRAATTRLEDALNGDKDLELRAEALRLADRAVGQVIGTVDAEDLLGEVFSQFCIGK